MTTSALASVLILECLLRGSTSHTDVGVELGLVEVVDNALDRINRSVHLEVTSDEELTTHFG